MIPSIEDIFHALSRGEMSFEDAEKYVRRHLELASEHDNMLDVFAGLAMQSLLHQEDLGPYFVSARKKALAGEAYALAKIMMAARGKA